MLGNTAATCEEAGIFRKVVDWWREHFKRYGADGLRTDLSSDVARGFLRSSAN